MMNNKFAGVSAERNSQQNLNTITMLHLICPLNQRCRISTKEPQLSYYAQKPGESQFPKQVYK